METNKDEKLDEQVETITQEKETSPTIVKKNGTVLSLLAILIALAMGGAGYYYGQQQFNQIQQQFTTLEDSLDQLSTPSAETENNGQITQLLIYSQGLNKKITQLEKDLSAKNQAINQLQHQLVEVANSAKPQTAQPKDWLLSETDFLLNNALRKLVLDNDVETSISLLKLADQTIAKIDNSETGILDIHNAIYQDLKLLFSLNAVDQNAVMQRLSQLANMVDELPLLDMGFDELNSDKPSNSITDWKENIGKSASSFLNRFIRIAPKNSHSKELLAPNQDIYLRENIRLRLQLAILAVPRQHNDLYEQSIEAVSSWVHSYFDTDSAITQNFLKSLDELSDVSIYVDVPEQLQSLIVLDKLLHRTVPTVKKVEIKADKATAELPQALSESPSTSTNESKE